MAPGYIRHHFVRMESVQFVETTCGGLLRVPPLGEVGGIESGSRTSWPPCYETLLPEFYTAPFFQMFFHKSFTNAL